MKASPFRIFLFVILICLGAGCANIVPPGGGKKDVRPPKLLSVLPSDSLLNIRVTRVEMHFDEFVDPTIPVSEVSVSPLLPMPVSIMAYGRKVVLHIPDSLLKDATTYRVSFGNGIKDLHEGNVFGRYTYTFSTGAYFDSLKLGGNVIDAFTGFKDTSAFIILYDAKKSDSAVVKEKPLYVTKVKPDGSFFFAGLPQKEFRIYALRDANNNLIFDGGKEAIAFIDDVVVPADTVTNPVKLRVFVEENKDTARVPEKSLGKRNKRNLDKESFSYAVIVDTSNITKRSFDITKPLVINFNKEPDTFNKSRMYLNYDSSGIAVEVPFDVTYDTAKETLLQLNAAWKEDKEYTLRLLKGFAHDSSGAEAMPSRHTFRTKNGDDYAKLNIHLPAKYNSKEYLMVVSVDADTVHNKPVTDTMIHLTRLKPGNYSLKIVHDSNLNGKWDTGDLLEKIQPEEIIPYDIPVQLKAGWDNTTDFVHEEKKPKPSSPGKRDKTPSK